MKITLLTMLALLAFAGNSILCRLALGDNAIDAASFTAIRLLSGIIILTIILKVLPTQDTAFQKDTASSKGSWQAAFMLFLYALGFSYAYVSLDTGIGALILFASVQITMILIGLRSGNRLYAIEWLGVIVSFCGFVYLVFPELTSPSLMGFLLMAAAGIAWAFYTLAGKGSANPLSDTTYNFIRTLPFVIILIAATTQYVNLSSAGVILAVLSGAITSGIGYAIWYMALDGLSGTQAAVVQLLVPVIAAVGGIAFADEVLSMRLVLSSIIILGGILMVVLGKNYKTMLKNSV